MKSSRRSVLMVISCWLVVLAGDLLAGFAFVDDFQPHEMEPEWAYAQYPAILIDDFDRVYLFWDAQIDHPIYSAFHQIYFRRLNSLGQPLSEIEMITDSTRCAQFSLPLPGCNIEGKWALGSQVIWTSPECWPGCPMDLMCWFSDEEGLSTDSGISVGGEILPTWYNDMGACDVDSMGNFIVGWVNREDSNNVWCQLFDPDGIPLTDTIRVQDNSCIDDPVLVGADQPRVAMTPDGGFVIAFQAYCDLCEPGNWIADIFARSYNSDCTPRTDIICATCWGDSAQHFWNGGNYPSLAVEDNGDYAITWRQYRDGCQVRVAMRRFSSNGSPKGQQIVVDSGMCGLNIASWIASDSVGNLVVAWQDDKESSNYKANLLAQRYDTAGNAVGQKFRINNGNYNVSPFVTSVAMNNNGLVGFFWNEFDEFGQNRDMVQLMDLKDVGVYVSCDANNDRLVNITDAVFLINYIFAGGVPPAHECLGNANGDELVNITDAVALISYIFSNGEIVEGCPD